MYLQYFRSKLVTLFNQSIHHHVISHMTLSGPHIEDKTMHQQMNDPVLILQI